MPPAALVGARPNQYWGLKCGKCGNDRRFIQVIAFEANLVDRHINHIHLEYAEVDRYECVACGRTVAPQWHRTATRGAR